MRKLICPLPYYDEASGNSNMRAYTYNDHRYQLITLTFVIDSDEDVVDIVWEETLAIQHARQHLRNARGAAYHNNQFTMSVKSVVDYQS